MGGNLGGVPVPPWAWAPTLKSGLLSSSPSLNFTMAELRHCICGKDYWWPGERWQHTGCVANGSVANSGIATVANEVPDKYVRYRDKDRRREYMRAYMRKRRTGVDNL